MDYELLKESLRSAFEQLEPELVSSFVATLQSHTEAYHQIPVQKLQPKLFDFDHHSQPALQHLDQEGYVVVKDYVSADFCDRFNREFFDYLEKSNFGFRTNDQRTWSYKNMPTEGQGATQFNAGFLGIYHLPTQNELRFSPRSQRIWTEIWSYKCQRFVGDLWTGIDRINFMPPTHQKKVNATKETFLHWDQNARKEPNFCKLQAVLNLVECDIETGTFTCVPKSHLSAFTLLNHKWATTRDMVNVPTENDFDARQIWARRVALEMPKGSICIWDSRLAHGNIPNKSDHRYRLVTYPRMFVPPQDPEVRKHDAEIRLKVMTQTSIIPGDQRRAFGGAGYTRPRWKQEMRLGPTFPPWKMSKREEAMIV
jgi:phytanoyl-CoA dioxygenase PhyH